MTGFPSFEAMFEAAYPGRSPFPWQRRLVRDILSSRWSTLWPAVLDLPTGVGKTSTLDIALYCLAAAPDRMPRRTVLVVDRRIVVDQGAVRARELLTKMERASDGPLAVIAARLRSLWGADSGPPFAVAVMRGGVPRDNDWARFPDQPIVGVSTVDQIGSRLLFRGYGVKRLSASIHAGLIGNDTLILLDEVHLAAAFADTLDKIQARFRSARASLPARFVTTQMSATVRSVRDSASVFGLDDADRADPVLDERLRASKRAALRTVKVTGDDELAKLEAVAARAVEEAVALQSAGARVVAIVVNRVDTARIARRLLEAHGATDAELITGRMRPLERDHLVQHRLLPRAGAERTRSAEEHPLVVVATQCIEAGADLDFDAIVTECASLDALRQRFGRVDRRGKLVSSNSVILCRSDQTVRGTTDPVYGASLSATWCWLGERATKDVVDFGIAHLPAHQDAGLLPADPEVPVLLPAHLDAWAQTSQPLAADPDVSLWLHGNEKPGADVQVVWRVDPDLNAADDERLRPLIERLQVCRPSALEAITIPLAAARRWLDNGNVESIADVEASAAGEGWARRQAGASATRVLRWDGDDSEFVLPRDIRPGDLLVLEAGRGGMRYSSCDPTSCEQAVMDLGDLAQLRARGVATLHLDREALKACQLPAALVAILPAVSSSDDPDERAERIQTWLALWPESKPDAFLGTENEWHAMTTALQSKAMRITVDDGGVILTAPTKLSPEVDDAVTEDDDSSFRRAEVSLVDHSADVREQAVRYARSLGFSAELVDDLGLAAWLHDIGKADPRFQRWLVGGSDVAMQGDQVLAKSALPPGSVRERRLARKRAGYPDGYRHELLSLAMIQHAGSALDTAHDRDLVLHLVSSHHGWCRPFPPPVIDDSSLEVRLRHGEHEFHARTDHELARLDSGVAERFWTLVARYGWWGLAWLEAVIRLADHRASEKPARTGAAR